MSKTPTRDEFHAEAFISECAVHGATARHRAAAGVAPGAGVAPTGSTDRPAPRVTPSPASATRPLRRWSVAELIARSAAPPRPVS